MSKLNLSLDIVAVSQLTENLYRPPPKPRNQPKMLVLLPNRVELTIPHCQNSKCTLLWHCHNTSLAALLTLPLSCLFPLEKQMKKEKPGNFILDQEQQLQERQFLCRFLPLGSWPAAHWDIGRGRCGREEVSSRAFILLAQAASVDPRVNSSLQQSVSCEQKVRHLW